MSSLASGRSGAARYHWMLRSLLCITTGLLAVQLVSVQASGQMIMRRSGAPEEVDDATKAAIIDSVAMALNEVYVFPDVARKMEKALRRNMRMKAYKDLQTYDEFTRQLTEDLYEIGNDKHLHVDYYPEQDFRSIDEDSLSDEEHRRMMEWMTYNNYGFIKLERMAGNVGYLELHAFHDAKWAGGPQ